MSELTAKNPVPLFKALSEELRLRILRVLGTAELSVIELTEALGAPQSTISRHLAYLRKADLVSTRREGTLVFYSRGPALENGLTELLTPFLSSLPHAEADRTATERLLDRRRRLSQSYFDKVARHYSEIAEPGGSWRALAGALALGYEGKTVADIGAGEGEISVRLARSAKRVYAVDHSAEMVKLLKERAKGLPNLTVEKGDLESLPLPDASCDVAIVSQVLHHSPRPAIALAEAARILRPGGRLIVLDLARHDQEWTREKLADYWLGFDEAELSAWAKAAGFTRIEIETDQTTRDALSVLTLTGVKAACNAGETPALHTATDSDGRYIKAKQGDGYEHKH